MPKALHTNGPRGLPLLAAFAVTLSAAAAAAAPADDTITGSMAGDFVLGQKLAQCSAHYEFLADQAKALRKPAAETYLRNLGRGWLLAGQFALKVGSMGKRTDIAAMARDLRSVQATQLAAMVEMDGVAAALPEISAMRERDCDPLISQQEAIVSALRQMR